MSRGRSSQGKGRVREEVTKFQYTRCEGKRRETHEERKNKNVIGRERDRNVYENKRENCTGRGARQKTEECEVRNGKGKRREVNKKENKQENLK